MPIVYLINTQFLHFYSVCVMATAFCWSGGQLPPDWSGGGNYALTEQQHNSCNWKLWSIVRNFYNKDTQKHQCMFVCLKYLKVELVWGSKHVTLQLSLQGYGLDQISNLNTDLQDLAPANLSVAQLVHFVPLVVIWRPPARLAPLNIVKICEFQLKF